MTIVDQGDPTAIEEDLSETRTIGHRQTSGLETERQQLAHIGQTGFFEAAFDGHNGLTN